jgi:ketosteroid isomerase-like protein
VIASGLILAPSPLCAQDVVLSPVPKGPCCLTNFRYSGTCQVVPRQGQICENILSYLNNINASGEEYCSATYIRGGWTLIDCDSGAAAGPVGFMKPQAIKTEEPGTVTVTSPTTDTNVRQPERAQSTTGLGELKVSDPGLIQVRLTQPLEGDTLAAGQEFTGRLETDVLGPDGAVVAPAGSTISAAVGAENAWDAPSAAASAHLQLVGATTSAADLFGTADSSSAKTASDTASIHLTGDLVEVSQDSVVSFQLKDVSDQPADMRVLTTATTVWMDAFNTGDAVTIAGLSSENGALLPPNGRAIIGRDAIYSYWKNLLADADTTVELVNIETVVDGDLGYKAGRFDLRDTATGASIDTGKYIQIWKRSPQGYWELYRDMWNSSVSAGGSGS